jgi:hypothetical protein
MEQNGPTVMMFSSMPVHDDPYHNPSTKCVVEEIPPPPPPSNENNPEVSNQTEQIKEQQKVKIEVINNENINHIENEEHEEGTVVSEEDDVNPISKSKLLQMKIEKLRKLCKDRGLSTEGLKPQLIERLLGLTRE